MFLLIFFFFIVSLAAQNVQVPKFEHVSVEMQNSLMETIFKNTSYELLNYDLNNSLTRNLTVDDYVEKYTQQMNLEFNKLLNEIFLTNTKNYNRNYTNQMKEFFLKGFSEIDKASSPLNTMIDFEQIIKFNENLYELVLEMKGLLLLNNNNSNFAFNESGKYNIGNEIMKGIIRYYLNQNKITDNFSKKAINSFDFSEAIDIKWNKIEQNIQNSLNFIRLHIVTNNTAISEEIEKAIVFNVTLSSIQPMIKDGTILIDFSQRIINKKENSTVFKREFEPAITIYIFVLIFLIILSGLFLLKMLSESRKIINYDTF